MILIKLGGSIITDKGRPLSARRAVMDGIAGELRKIDEPVVLVHGGGSYGHYWSVRHGMHTRQDTYDVSGVATVKDSMVRLNAMVLESLLEGGLSPYCLPPAAFMSVRGRRPVPARIREVGAIAGSGLIPVTFGDAMWYGNGMTYILSGDRIMTHLARTLRPRLCIFALDEDGLYSDMASRRVIREVAGAGARASPPGEGATDVTGGMARKVREALIISGTGSSDVCLVNGARPERIVRAARGGRFVGTVFRRRRSGAGDGAGRRGRR